MRSALLCITHHELSSPRLIHACVTGAHLLVVDADIQFNHWELSAKSLVVALLNPLMAYDKQFLGAASTS
jgi:hypothetical protein